MKIFTYIWILFLILLGISFSLLNAGTVNVNYFLGNITLPVSFLIILSIVFGAVLSFFFCMLSLLCQKATVRGLRKKIESLEKTVNVISTSHQKE